MPIHMDMPHSDIRENVEIEKKPAAIRTALFLEAFSQVIPVSYYLWQIYC
jgi:hypothetical protein